MFKDRYTAHAGRNLPVKEFCYLTHARVVVAPSSSVMVCAMQTLAMACAMRSQPKGTALRAAEGRAQSRTFGRSGRAVNFG